jgi:hypothetical protein
MGQSRSAVSKRPLHYALADDWHTIATVTPTLKVKERLKIEVPHRGVVGEKSGGQLIRRAEKRRVSRAVRRPAKGSIRWRQVDHVENIVGKRAQGDAVATVHADVLAAAGGTSTTSA